MRLLHLLSTLEKKTPRIRRQRKRRMILRPVGSHYNLEEIYHEINQAYFNGKVDAKITWFGRGLKTPKSSITFGSYNHHLKLIKINKLLDSGYYPDFFVRFIVYHEMLHHIYPPKRGKRGRRNIHHAEFKQKESQFKEIALAKQFLQQWRRRHFETC